MLFRLEQMKNVGSTTLVVTQRSTTDKRFMKMDRYEFQQCFRRGCFKVRTAPHGEFYKT